METDRPLPHSLAAEQAILGAILLDNKLLEAAGETLRPADFFLPQHRKVYGHMVAMREAGEPIDSVTLMDALHKCGELEAAGGAAYLAQLLDGVPRVSNVGHYAHIVKEKALLRKLAHTAHATMRAAIEGHESPEEIVRRSLASLEMLSAQYKGEVWAETGSPFLTGKQIAEMTPAKAEYIAFPWQVRGGITEWDGKIKVSGKTTLVTHMVRSVLDGANFLGHSTKKTAVVYLTEQSRSSFRVAMERAGLSGREDFVVLFWQDVFNLEWPAIVELAVNQCSCRGAELLVVDTISQFTGIEGDAENNSGDALTAMRPLQLAAARHNLSIAILRHERKSGGDVGDSARGSTAFGGAADTIVSLRRPEGKHRDTIRELRAVSRFDGVPSRLLIELRDGLYVSLGDLCDVELGEARDTIAGALPANEANAVPLKELLKDLSIKRSTAQRAIEQLLEEEVVNVAGTGKRNDPYKYFRLEKVAAQTPNTRLGQKESASESADPSVKFEEVV